MCWPSKPRDFGGPPRLEGHLATSPRFSFGRRAQTYCPGCSVLFWGQWLKNKRENKAFTDMSISLFLLPYCPKGRCPASRQSPLLGTGSGRAGPPCHGPGPAPGQTNARPRAPALTESHHRGQHEGADSAGPGWKCDHVLLRQGLLGLPHQVLGDAELRPVVGDDAALAGERGRA